MALEQPPSGLTRAIRSPVAPLAAVVAAGLGALAGLSVLGIVLLAFVAEVLALVVLAARATGGRRARPERIDPFALGEPWRLRVRAAQGAQSRYRSAIAGTPAGPTRERLAEIGARIDAGVDECWRIAKQGDALGDGLRALDPGATRRALLAAEEDGSDGARLAALRAQVDAADRLASTAADADTRLQLLAARLDEAAARAVELSLGGAGTEVELAGLGSEVDETVDQLEALRQALGEVGG